MDTKLMKVADEFASFDNLKPKDPPCPRFLTQEIESMFILSIQLKGYNRRDIKVEINEDESRITISGEKPVQDMLMIGGKVVKKHIEMHKFQKSFKIPKGVVLNRVKARFNEDNSELIIPIPKATKGLMGIVINELKTEEILPESTELLQVYANGELSEQENQEIEEENVQDGTKNVSGEGLEGKYEFSHAEQEKDNPKQEQIGTDHTRRKGDDSQEPKSPQRRFKICTPVLFGSALFISLIVMVLQFVQSEKQEKSKKKTEQD